MKEYNQLEIGERIRKLRKEKNFTRDELAEYADMSAKYLGNWKPAKRFLLLK